MDDSYETIPDDQILEPKSRRLRQLRLPVEKVKTVEVLHPESGRAVINESDLPDYEARGWSIPGTEAEAEIEAETEVEEVEAPKTSRRRK